ncbi:hypothetical protein QFC21_002579 [Naganishia friedmannii]|uniref:Uncharacterized protein n=1 Tax=Naganishia friedmannii TaxID=89922 RepID=A0ACC2VXK8_9TREE|nr:hypothetical protein QFC21_002579 [Naganishia friedmannii]
MDDDGFTTVKKSQKGRAPRRPPSGQANGKTVSRMAYDTRVRTSSSQKGLTLEDKLEKVLAILQTRRRQLLDDDQGVGKGNTFLKRWKGIDDPADPSRSSQTSAPVQIPVDLALLGRRGYQLIPKNECGKHKLDPKLQTLVYMPHCPGKLYDAFLRENWDLRIICNSLESSERADDAGGDETERPSGRVVLFANDFRGYIENNSRSQIQNELPSIHRLTPHLSTIPFPSLPPGHIATNAFNSLIFQYLGSDGAKEVDWDMIPPVGCGKEGVTDTEVIAGEIQSDLEMSMSSLSLEGGGKNQAKASS